MNARFFLIVLIASILCACDKSANSYQSGGNSYQPNGNSYQPNGDTDQPNNNTSQTDSTTQTDSTIQNGGDDNTDSDRSESGNHANADESSNDASDLVQPEAIDQPEDSTPSTSKPEDNPLELTVTQLRDQKTSFNEGELVRLSLDTDASEALTLSYQWAIDPIDGQEIDFDGQNTDTITFIAPAVEEDKAISVGVSITMSIDNYAGETLQDAIIVIRDTNPDPRKLVVEHAFTKALPPLVDDYSVDVFNVPGTWEVTTYDISLEGDSVVFTSNKTLADIGRKEGKSSPSARLCEYSFAFDVTRLINNTSTQCNDGTPAAKYYQDEENLVIERYCGELIVESTALSRLATDAAAAVGTVNLAWGESNTLSTSQNICLNTAKIISLRDGVVETAHSELQIQVPYNNSSLYFNLETPVVAHGASNHMIDNGDTILNLQSIDLHNINGIDANKGSLLIQAWGDDTINLNFDVNIDGQDGTVESVRGDIQINLRNKTNL